LRNSSAASSVNRAVSVGTPVGVSIREGADERRASEPGNCGGFGGRIFLMRSPRGVSVLRSTGIPTKYSSFAKPVLDSLAGTSGASVLCSEFVDSKTSRCFCRMGSMGGKGSRGCQGSMMGKGSVGGKSSMCGEAEEMCCVLKAPVFIVFAE
jgi:hypothetical protein